MIHSHQFYPEQQIEFLGKISCRASCFDLKWHDFYAHQFGSYAKKYCIYLVWNLTTSKRHFSKFQMIWKNTMYLFQLAGFKGKFHENYCMHCINTQHSCSWIQFIGFSSAWQHLTNENATNCNSYCHQRHCQFT